MVDGVEVMGVELWIELWEWSKGIGVELRGGVMGGAMVWS